VAVAGTSAVIFLGWILQGRTHAAPLYPFFTLLIIVSALSGGLRAGLLALGSSLFYTICFILLPHHWPPVQHSDDWLSIAAFAVVGISVSLIAAFLNERNAELEAERARWQGVVEGIAEEVWVCNTQRKMSLANLPVVTSMGLDPFVVTSMGLDPFKDRSLEELLAQVDILYPDGTVRPAEEAPLFRSLRGEVVRGEEIMRHRKTGKMRYRQFSSAPTRDMSGAITGAVAIVRDITDLKLAEEALVRSEKLAATGRLAATIAHEVNNPLAAAMNALYLARIDPTLTPETGDHLLLVDQELRRAAHIVQQTLGFYRETSNRTAVALPKLIDEVLAIYARKLKDRCITVQCRYKCGPCREGCETCFQVNAGEMRQIISNLLANGMDALRDKGMLHIRVSRLATLERSEPLIQLTMADNGCGIAPENLKRLFEPFFTTKGSVGTGLGLWITRELVRKHGGSIRVRSRKDKGTVFRITIPAKATATEREQAG
jgi:signal transduction histidine kinase